MTIVVPELAIHRLVHSSIWIILLLQQQRPLLLLVGAQILKLGLYPLVRTLDQEQTQAGMNGGTVQQALPALGQRLLLLVERQAQQLALDAVLMFGFKQGQKTA